MSAVATVAEIDIDKLTATLWAATGRPGRFAEAPEDEQSRWRDAVAVSVEVARVIP